MLFSGVDQCLVQIDHQDQFLVPVESLLVFSAQLLCLLLKETNTVKKILTLIYDNKGFHYSVNYTSNMLFFLFVIEYLDIFPVFLNLFEKCDLFS